MITDIENFDDFCLWMYCIVDDVWRYIRPLSMLSRSGPPPRCSDSELLTMALVGECRGWNMETQLLSQWHDYPHLFPSIPSQSRFNRRRRYLAQAFNMVRRVVLSMLDVAQERKCVIDSLPVPVVKFHLAPRCRASGAWATQGARYGTVSTKREKIYGYKLHLLVTLGGVILDFELAGANIADPQIGEELLGEHTDLMVVADKGFVSEPLARKLWHSNRVRLLALTRANQKVQLPSPLKAAINQVRQVVETVNSQLAGQFNLEVNHAHSLAGLVTRLYTKLAAHTLCIHINRLLGKADFLNIKHLAFPLI
jgi:hypothetical protein